MAATETDKLARSSRPSVSSLPRWGESRIRTQSFATHVKWVHSGEQRVTDMKLTAYQINLLRLIKRSEKDADEAGWCRVSNELWTYLFCGGIAEELKELIKVRRERGGVYIRLSEKGKVVLEYLV